VKDAMSHTSNPNLALHDALLARGWIKTRPTDSGSYERHGARYLTWRKNGITIASSGTSRVYNASSGNVETLDGCGSEVTIEALTTEVGLRHQGLARTAILEWVNLAASAGVDLYLEPVPLEPGIALDRLITLYASVGFSPCDNSKRVMSNCRPAARTDQLAERAR